MESADAVADASTIPTLNVVDDTFDTYRAEMDAVIQEAKDEQACSEARSPDLVALD